MIGCACVRAAEAPTRHSTCVATGSPCGATTAPEDSGCLSCTVACCVTEYGGPRALSLPPIPRCPSHSCDLPRLQLCGPTPLHHIADALLHLSSHPNHPPPHSSPPCTLPRPSSHPLLPTPPRLPHSLPTQSLPNSLTGTLQRDQISDYFYDHAAAGTEGEACRLKELLSVGQLVRCGKVLPSTLNPVCVH